MNQGIERIKILASKVKDKPLLKIVKYLLSREDMNDKYLNEEKNLSQMIEFIKSEAKKQARDGIAMIDDAVVYGWAIHYWDESNKSLNVEKTSSNNEIGENKANNVSYKKVDVNKKNWVPEGQLSLFDFN